VPDLAFNELKFLRESNEHQDEHHVVHGNMPKSSNQDRKREVEREKISAYFDQRNQKPDLAPDRRTTRTNLVVIEGEMLTDHEDVREGGSSPRLPDEELPVVPYLGFGSKGTISKSTNPPPSTTSYLTWSESGDGLAASRKRKPDFKTALEAGQLSVPRPAAMRRSRRDIPKLSASDTAKGPNKNRTSVSKSQRATLGRIRVPENINVYTDLDVAESVPSIETLRDTKSQSSPTERPKKGTRHQRKRAHAADLTRTPSSGDESFYTSDILKIRSRLQGLAEPLPSEPISTHALPHDKENVPPPSSSPTAKILRTAHGAMMQHQLGMSVQSPASIRQRYGPDSVQRQRPSYPPTLFPHQAEPHLRPLSEENFEYLSTGRSASLKDRYAEQHAWQDMHDAYDEVVEPEDAEMLDAYAIGELQLQDIDNDAGYQRYAYVHSTLGTRFNVRSLPRPDHKPSKRRRDTPWSRSGIATTRGGTSHNTLTEKDVSIREDRIVDQDFEDGLEGFWRPNRLY
jgi:hypothetical protein